MLGGSSRELRGAVGESERYPFSCLLGSERASERAALSFLLFRFSSYCSIAMNLNSRQNFFLFPDRPETPTRPHRR